MDPNSGRIYDLSDPTIPDDVRQRLIEVPSENPTEEELREALRKEFVEAEAAELGDILDKMEEVKNLPDEEERFYSTNRAARRAMVKRDRALKKRDLRG